ncbi:ribosome biogenesis GTPase Der [Fontivita pretiosa]|uniref:ribosome biogenesis GTPase Der n=1 Tax=Fontivita pretiosa TaxID=2989684 RepID=UPI003D176C12
MPNRMPTIAIVGRPNVGKSSLLNALAGRRISIVQDVPGVTRDRVSAPIQIAGKWVELVDTGGYGFVDPDALTEHIQQQIEIAMSRADLVLFVVDAADGLTAADEEIARLLRKRGVKTLLVANKADSPRADVSLAEFARLGFGTPIGVSALNARNIDQLVQAIAANIDLDKAPAQLPEPQLLVAIVGKRNAGKSTLVNAIARLYEDDPQRVIVSEVPGTTRDSIDVRFEKDGKTLVVIDTAGVRKKRQMVTHDLEFYSFHRAQRSIRRADVVMMLIDGTEPLSEPDRKLSQYIAEQYKPVLLVVNKWDLSLAKARQIRAGTPEENISDEKLMQEFEQYLHTEMPHLSFAPVAFVTATEGKNVQAALDMAQHLFKQANQRIGTGRLNAVIKQIFEQRMPSTPRGQRPKILYATQVDVAPPTIVLFVNNPELFDANYQRFIVNRFRELLPFGQVPIRLLIRGRDERQIESQRGSGGQESQPPAYGGQRPAESFPQPQRPSPIDQNPQQ